MATPNDSLPAYAELQCISNFTFLRGASHPQELVERAAALGYTALALTDECSLAGIVRAHQAAQECGLRLLVGSQFRLDASAHGPALSLILLAMNREGYGNLCELITLGRTRAGKGTYHLTTADLAFPEGEYLHLRRMPDCLAILMPEHGIDGDALRAQARWLAAVFGTRARIALTLLLRGQDDKHRARIEKVAAECGLPIVATGDVCMHVRSRKPLQDTLSAIRLGRPLDDCGYELTPNAEQHLRSRVRLANLYPAAALAETLKVAEECRFSLDELRYAYPDEFIPPGETAASYLRKETERGARWRYPEGIPDKVRNQLEHELELIAEMQYEPYFLTVYDIVRFARSEKILCQGRGSAANSAVCYCLGITAVDPARADVLFERFISKERNEPPDIDVDFEHQRREEVIQYVYKKYGRLRAGMTAVVIHYRPRSVLRDVGKALGVDLSIVDKVAKSHRWWDSKTELAERFAECGLDPHSPLARRWAQLAVTLIQFPRHLSQHPGGFVIARDKLSRLVPIENAAMEGRSVVQWDKDDLDAVGLMKVDLLALGMLSMLRRACDLLGEQHGKAFDLPDIPAEDPQTYAMIREADTVGVFQIESRAQMSMLPRLRPEKFYDLVIQVAIVRPGPIQGGMVHPYLRRRQGLEPVSYPREEVRSALERTLGVPIFQEQVMQIAMKAAGFSAGKADELRRAMAAWRRKGNLGKFQEDLVAGMRAKDYPQDFIDSIVNQIHGFAEYGFPESHAASFALLAYASSWFKCHHPAIFLTALLNSQPMGFYSPSQLVQDARRHRIAVRPVDIHASSWDARLESPRDPAPGAQPAVRLGFNLVRGLSAEIAGRIVAARAAADFSSLHDLALRAQLNRRELEALAQANALASLAGHRRAALWQAVAGETDKDLLKAAQLHEESVVLAPPTEGQEIVADYRAFGLSLGRHPLALLRPLLRKRDFYPASALNTYRDGSRAHACGIVTGRQRPGTAGGTIFVTLEDETGNVNVIVWPDVIDTYRKELLGARLLGVHGKWQTDNKVRHLIAYRLLDLSDLLGSLETRSRNFM